MDAQILEELVSIRWMTTVIAINVGVFAIAYIVSLALNFSRAFESAQTNDFFNRGNAPGGELAEREGHWTHDPGVGAIAGRRNDQVVLPTQYVRLKIAPPNLYEAPTCQGTKEVRAEDEVFR